MIQVIIYSTYGSFVEQHTNVLYPWVDEVYQGNPSIYYDAEELESYKMEMERGDLLIFPSLLDQIYLEFLHPIS